ncbi:MAG TPA: hypothetical protein VNT02_12850 [Burkholderiales bacterium]|nr:hypothetical protein [Burkholderiales bacterium]
MQVLLPLADNEGRAFPRSAYDRVRDELAERFGGVTAYVRAPAEGLWKEDARHVARDDVVIYEVMTDALDRAWWAAYRLVLQERFRQEELVVRATGMERL